MAPLAAVPAGRAAVTQLPKNTLGELDYDLPDFLSLDLVQFCGFVGAGCEFRATHFRSISKTPPDSIARRTD